MIVAVSRLRPSCMAVVPVAVVAVAVAVAVVPWTWPRHGRDRVVFVSPSHGCDTPMDASVCNGLCGVCVVLVCYLTG